MNSHAKYTKPPRYQDVDSIRTGFSNYSEGGSQSIYTPKPPLNEPLNSAETQEGSRTMTQITQGELDAKLANVKLELQVSVTAIDTKIGDFITQLDGRLNRNDDRMVHIEKDIQATSKAIANLKSTVIVTAISVALAIIIGIATFNATALSSMVASFESGKNTASDQAELKRQSEQTAALLRQLQKDVDAKKK